MSHSDLSEQVSVASPLPRVGLVGPLPPPSGGMSNQCEQLKGLLESEGFYVELVCTNKPYWPHWVGQFSMLRSLFRLVPYVFRLWQVAGRSDVMHVFANSGWAWHLFVAPAVTIANLRGVSVVINYHGGQADAFLEHAPSYVLKMLSRAALLITPSNYLLRIFQKYELSAEVIPNVVDLSRFVPADPREFDHSPHLIVTRNLESIYDIPTAIRAFSRIRLSYPGAQLTIAGSGPERGRLQSLVNEFELADCVKFIGRIDNSNMQKIYAVADCMLNPSTVDNMPISILEAFSSGVPVVSTNVGGIPDIMKDGVSGLLVQVGDDEAMAEKIITILRNSELTKRIRNAGFEEAKKCGWTKVGPMWMSVYLRATVSGSSR